MGLDQSAEAFVGALLHVRPIQGYGWSEALLRDSGYEHHALLVPPPHTIRLKRLWSFEADDRRGGVAQVEAPGHAFDGLWMTFSTRHEGVFNFTDVAIYNVDLSTTEPIREADGWPLSPDDPRSDRCYSGWAEIAAHASEPVATATA